MKSSDGPVPSDEFRLLAELDHPALPRIESCGVSDGRFWFATRWIEGGSLDDAAGAGIDEEAFAAGAIHALLYLDCCGIVHGDVHPGNLLASREGAPARLVDFGLASDGGNLHPAGRPGFIAPEVRSGARRSLASDLYGLGMSLRERGLARGAAVARLVDGLVSADVQGRIESAVRFATGWERPSCGPRRVWRGRAAAGLLGMVKPPSGSGVRGVLLVGGAGIGKTELLWRLRLEAMARGWSVAEAGRAGGAVSVEGLEERGSGLLVWAEDVDRGGRQREVLREMEAVAGGARGGCLVVATSRVRVPGWAWDVMDMEGLGARELGEVFRQVSGVAELADDRCNRIAACAQGAPGRVVEMARAASAAGLLVSESVGWVLRAGVEIPLPADALETGRRVLAALEPGLAETVAVVGLAEGAISRAGLVQAGAVRAEDLSRLEALGLVKSEGEAAVVADAALAGAAVEMLAAEARRKAHAAIGMQCEQEGVVRRVAARHWIQAGVPDRSALAAIEGARELVGIGDIDGAHALAVSALSVEGLGPEAKWRLDAEAVAIESEMRSDAAMAKAAEGLAFSAPDVSGARRMAALAIGQWARIREWREVEAAAGRLSGVAGDWVWRRAEVAREIEALSRAEGAAIADPRGVGSARLASEARLAGYRLALQGDFRGAARAEIRALRLAAALGEWRIAGSAVEGAVVDLVLAGHMGRASRVVEWGEAAAMAAGRSSRLPGLACAKATLAAAGGRVAYGLALATEITRLSILAGETPAQRNGRRGLEAELLRYSGRASEAMDVCGPRTGDSEQVQAWLKTQLVMGLLDLGRWEEAADVARCGADWYRKVGDESGAAILDSLGVEALRQSRAGTGWRAAAAALPAGRLSDRMAGGLCAWVRGEALLAGGQEREAESLAGPVLEALRTHRLTGGEAAVRLAAALASAGRRTAAEELLSAASPVPDSPILEVWHAVARSRLERHAVASRRVLESVREKVERAGEAGRKAWHEEWSKSAGECGRGNPGGVPGEQGGDVGSGRREGGRDLASEARHIRDIVRDLNAERNVQRLLEKILDSAIAIGGAERGCLVLVDGNRFEVRVSRPEDAGLGGTDAFSRTISDKVLLSGEPFFTKDALKDRRLAGSSSIPRLNVHSVACVPFRLRGATLGSLYLDHRRNADAFDPGTLDALQTLADLAAVAIENARLFEESERQREALAARAEKLEKRLERVDLLRQGDAEAGLRHRYPAIVGRGPAMIEMLRAVDRAAGRSQPVLIHGETGTGKELVARALHANGPFRKGPFVAENCAAISPMLMESELFGHVKGAFSGATGEHAGLFRRADGGVLFLDEIGDLDLSMQAKLLRVLEDGEVRPVGSDRTFQVKVRVVTATHRDLQALVGAGKFRADLYYRLSPFRVNVPSLRERREDIPALVGHFLAGLGDRDMEPAAIKRLVVERWPGNVRQLEHLVGVLCARDEGTITVAAVEEVLEAEVVVRTDDQGGLTEALENLRATRVEAALIRSGGDMARAAEDLGITYQGVRRIALKHNLMGLRMLRLDLNRRSTRGRRERRPSTRKS